MTWIDNQFWLTFWPEIRDVHDHSVIEANYNSLDQKIGISAWISIILVFITAGVHGEKWEHEFHTNW